MGVHFILGKIPGETYADRDPSKPENNHSNPCDVHPRFYHWRHPFHIVKQNITSSVALIPSGVRISALLHAFNCNELDFLWYDLLLQLEKRLS